MKKMLIALFISVTMVVISFSTIKMLAEIGYPDKWVILIAYLIGSATAYTGALLDQLFFNRRKLSVLTYTSTWVGMWLVGGVYAFSAACSDK